ncbi:MAG TPA: hypothetical protein V6D29_21210 [Leptolyngbyaceae cyanobacterium]
MSLSDKVQDQTIRDSITADVTKLMDEQVSAKNGLSGLALKAAYGVVKGIGPSYIPGAVERLLPDALAAIDPIWTEGVQQGNPVEYLSQNKSRTADLLLSTTDARVERTDNGVIRSSYHKLRKSVKADVEAAVPSLAKILDTHIQA